MDLILLKPNPIKLPIKTAVNALPNPDGRSTRNIDRDTNKFLFLPFDIFLCKKLILIKWTS